MYKYSVDNEYIQSEAVKDILAERKRQDDLWGVQDHLPITWMAILMEEVGELSREALDNFFEGRKDDNLRDEAIQVAAVALALVECIDRNGYTK